MITATCQRWHARRDSYRPVGEPIRTAGEERDGEKRLHRIVTIAAAAARRTPR